MQKRPYPDRTNERIPWDFPKAKLTVVKDGKLVPVKLRVGKP